MYNCVCAREVQLAGTPRRAAPSPRLRAPTSSRGGPPTIPLTSARSTPSPRAMSSRSAGAAPSVTVKSTATLSPFDVPRALAIVEHLAEHTGKTFTESKELNGYFYVNKRMRLLTDVTSEIKSGAISNWLEFQDNVREVFINTLRYFYDTEYGKEVRDLARWGLDNLNISLTGLLQDTKPKLTQAQKRSFRIVLDTLQVEGLDFLRSPLSYEEHELPGYADLIAKPLGLNEVTTRLECDEYTDPSMLAWDVRLVFQNSIDYSLVQDASEAAKLARVLYTRFLRALAKEFPGLPKPPPLNDKGEQGRPRSSSPLGSRGSDVVKEEYARQEMNDGSDVEKEDEEEEEEMMSPPAKFDPDAEFTPELKAKAAKLVEKISALPEATMFLVPWEQVAKAFPNYRSVIEKPMDLVKLRHGFSSTKRPHKTFAEFQRAGQLIFDNCKVFNAGIEDVLTPCRIVETEFQKGCVEILAGQPSMVVAPSASSASASSSSKKSRSGKRGTSKKIADTSNANIRVPNVLKVVIARPSLPASTEGSEFQSGEVPPNSTSTPATKAHIKLASGNATPPPPPPPPAATTAATSGKKDNTNRRARPSTAAAPPSGPFRTGWLFSLPSKSYFEAFHFNEEESAILALMEKLIKVKSKSDVVKRYFGLPVLALDPSPEFRESYLSIVPEPMDLETICLKLTKGEYKAEGLRKVTEDIELMCRNAAKFNEATIPWLAEAAMHVSAFWKDLILEYHYELLTSLPNNFLSNLSREDRRREREERLQFEYPSHGFVLYGLMKSLMTNQMKAKGAMLFLAPVNPVLFPNYLAVIKEPRDFSSIAHRCPKSEAPNPVHPYETYGEFIRDVRLVFSNCLLFNPAENPLNEGIRAQAEYVSTVFETELAKATLHVCDDVARKSFESAEAALLAPPEPEAPAPVVGEDAEEEDDDDDEEQEEEEEDEVMQQDEGDDEEEDSDTAFVRSVKKRSGARRSSHHKSSSHVLKVRLAPPSEELHQPHNVAAPAPSRQVSSSVSSHRASIVSDSVPGHEIPPQTKMDLEKFDRETELQQQQRTEANRLFLLECQERDAAVRRNQRAAYPDMVKNVRVLAVARTTETSATGGSLPVHEPSSQLPPPVLAMPRDPIVVPPPSGFLQSAAFSDSKKRSYEYEASTSINKRRKIDASTEVLPPPQESGFISTGWLAESSLMRLPPVKQTLLQRRGEFVLRCTRKKSDSGCYVLCMNVTPHVSDVIPEGGVKFSTSSSIFFRVQFSAKSEESLRRPEDARLACSASMKSCTVGEDSGRWTPLRFSSSKDSLDWSPLILSQLFNAVAAERISYFKIFAQLCAKVEVCSASQPVGLELLQADRTVVARVEDFVDV